MNKDNIEIPDSVVDNKSYIEYKEMELAMENDASRKYQTTDIDIQIDLLTTQYIIDRMIRHLPQEEKDIIAKKASEYRSLLSKRNILKRKAFGTLNGAKSVTDGLGPAAIKKAEILNMYGRYYSTAEIHKVCIQDWNLPISIEALTQFSKKHLTQIEELRKDYDKNYDDIRLTHKKSRLGELTWLYQDRKDRYFQNPTDANSRELRAIINDIKKECEGDIVINGKIHLEIEETIRIQLKQEILREFNITQLVISSLAGRLNINPMFLLSRLANSTYSKFTGFAVSDDIDMEEIKYPSSLTYNIDDIKRRNSDIVEEERAIKILPVMIEEAIIIEDVKDDLLQRLKVKLSKK